MSALAQLSKILTYDYKPQWSFRLDWLRQPIGVLLAAAVIGLMTGFLLHHNGYYFSAAVFLVILIGLLWPFVSTFGICANLHFDRDRSFVGETTEVRLTVQNRSLIGSNGVYYQWNDSRVEDDAEGPKLLNLPGFSQAQLDFSVQFARRGLAVQTPAKLGSGFPFGLMTSWKKISCDDDLLIWPRIFSLATLPTFGFQEHSHGRFANNRAGNHGDICGLRPYRRGDTPRRIHWSQTAKQDELIVCEYQSYLRPTLIVCLDGVSALPNQQNTSLLWEGMISLCASICHAAYEQGIPFGLVTESERIPINSGANHYRRSMDHLATLSPDCHHPQSSPATSADPQAMTILITSTHGDDSHITRNNRCIAIECAYDDTSPKSSKNFHRNRKVNFAASIPEQIEFLFVE